jgi:hypothetical protein
MHRQVIFDSHGEVAARICSILAEKGHLEADAIAEIAMVPAKDTREVRLLLPSFILTPCVVQPPRMHH